MEIAGSVEIQAEPGSASPYPLSQDSDFIVIRVLDGASHLSGLLAMLCLIAMALMMGYEVGARYLFNAPTIWATELSTYTLVAVVFLGLAEAQRSNAHVQVELWIDRLEAPVRRNVELVGQWLGFIFVAITTWQMIAFNWREYVNGTRDWGLLSTPQWIPQVPVSIGFVLYSFAILVDIYRLRPPTSTLRRWALPALVAILAAILMLLGKHQVPIAGSRLDWGTAAIAITCLAGVLAWSGVRIALYTTALCALLCLVYWLAQGQSLFLIGAILVIVMIFLLLFGVRIAISLGIVGLLGLYFLLPRAQLSLLAERAWSSTNTFTLTAVAMFIFMGGLLLKSGIATGMFDSMVRWFGRVPGGLAHATVGASAVFAAVSGSSLATAATLGKTSCPEMISRGYSPRLTYGSTAAGATLGILIPPSIPMIIYGSVVGVSVTHLFIAGIIPGLLLMAMFMGGVLVWSLIQPAAAPAARPYTVQEKISGSGGMVPFLLIIGAVLGTLYAGIATPTEAAAIGVISSFLLCVIRKKISFQALYEITLDSAKVTAVLLLIVVGAAIFSWVPDYIRIPREIVNLVKAFDVAPWMIVALLVAVYIVLGMFVESISMMLMTLPVTFPIAISLGLDPVWFGVFLVLMIELGLITPPVGLILFVLHSVNENVKFSDVIYGAVPFVAVMILFVILIYIYPDIVMWLPRQMQ